MRRPHVEPLPQPPSCEKYSTGDGQNIRPGRQVEIEENGGCIILTHSDLGEDQEATGTEEQDKWDARTPLNPLARHAVHGALLRSSFENVKRSVFYCF